MRQTVEIFSQDLISLGRELKTGWRSDRCEKHARINFPFCVAVRASAFILKARLSTEEPVVIIATTAVDELRVQRQDDSGLFLGALTSVTELGNTLSDIRGKLPG